MVGIHWEAHNGLGKYRNRRFGFGAIDGQRSFKTRFAEGYGSPPHQLAGLAYDGLAAIGALVSTGQKNAVTKTALTQASGFQGVSGVFRLLADGTNERALAIAKIERKKVVLIDAAPVSFGRVWF